MTTANVGIDTQRGCPDTGDVFKPANTRQSLPGLRQSVLSRSHGFRRAGGIHVTLRGPTGLGVHTESLVSGDLL